MKDYKKILFFVCIFFFLEREGLAWNADGRYHSYAEVLSDFEELAKTYPDLAESVNLGSSFEGRKIFALRITKVKEGKAKILLSGGIHAREWLGVETARLLAKYILEDYPQDKKVKDYLEQSEVWIVPIVNPDGFEYDRNTQALWRKNRRPIENSGIGVDLNRNFDFHWDPPQSASTNPASDTYRGPSPASETEVKIIQDLISQGFNAFIDFHSYSQIIVYPWGHTSSPAPDASTFNKIAQEMSQRMREVNNKNYRSGQIPHLLYPVSGDSIDYAYGKFKTYAFCIELPPPLGAFSFYPPSDYILPTAEENLVAVKYLMEYLTSPSPPSPSPEGIKVIETILHPSPRESP
ncbi:MAG: M14 family metallocarboxypeptidase, partial [Candidatus Omnitrophica bacterium]|nr:M14 family metallocarboxypeptidase [Candidatus Omnitrophota bacterium]